MFDIPFVSQSKDTICGPASLKMLLGYYGIDVPIEILIDECHVSVDGCTAADLLRVGRAHGLTSIAAYRANAASVLRQDRPGILYWRGNHFLVYGGLNDKGEPVLYNPGRGVYPIDADTFSKLYSGIVLTNGVPADIPPEDYFGEHIPDPDYFDK